MRPLYSEEMQQWSRNGMMPISHTMKEPSEKQIKRPYMPTVLLMSYFFLPELKEKAKKQNKTKSRNQSSHIQKFKILLFHLWSL